MTPKELSHRRSPGHLLARLPRNLITPARLFPIQDTWAWPKGAMRNPRSPFQQNRLTDLTPCGGGGEVLGGFSRFN